MKNFNSLPQIAEFAAQNNSHEHFLSFKKTGNWVNFSAKDFYQNICHLSFALRSIGLEKGEKIAIFSYQNPIWLIADFAAMLAGAVTVPIFHNISTENLFYELEDAAVKFVFTDNLEFAELIKSRQPQIKIIAYDFVLQNAANYDDLIALGAELQNKDKSCSFENFNAAINRNDLATIIYTSGSTGTPKGVELTHKNLLTQISDTQEFFPLKNSDVVLSFLPLAHIFERMVMMFYLTQPVRIYFVDDVKNLANFLREVQPTLMTTVPRMLEKVFAKISDGIEKSSFTKKFIGKKALARAISKDVEEEKSFCDKIFDKMVFAKFRQALGGKMRMVICGGSALSNDIERFYSNIGLNLFCGYGLTECAPVLAANCEKNHKFGTVGKNFSSVQLKIAQDGELLAKGDNIMLKYHNKATETAEIFADGWLKTGDLAQIDEEGFLKIVGRKKELFKTANGKYVTPVLIEQKIVQAFGFLIGAIVIAEGKKFVSAIIFPDFEIIKQTKEKFGFVGSDEDFINSKKLQKFAAVKIAKINDSLDHWQQIQKFHIASSAISIETGELTPSMKLKRKLLEEKYREVIENFYRE